MVAGYGSTKVDLGVYISTFQNNEEQQVNIPKTNLNIGRRSFSVCGPHLWNSLPVYLRQAESLMSFKSGLKTFYFNKEYFNV